MVVVARESGKSWRWRRSKKRRQRFLRRQKGMKGTRCGEGGEARFLTSAKRPRSVRKQCGHNFKRTTDQALRADMNDRHKVSDLGEASQLGLSTACVLTVGLLVGGPSNKRSGLSAR